MFLLLSRTKTVPERYVRVHVNTKRLTNITLQQHLSSCRETDWYETNITWGTKTQPPFPRQCIPPLGPDRPRSHPWIHELCWTCGSYSGSRLVLHCGNLSYGFCVILLTDGPTNGHRPEQNLFRGGNNNPCDWLTCPDPTQSRWHQYGFKVKRFRSERKDLRTDFIISQKENSEREWRQTERRPAASRYLTFCRLKRDKG